MKTKALTELKVMHVLYVSCKHKGNNKYINVSLFSILKQMYNIGQIVDNRWQHK